MSYIFGIRKIVSSSMVFGHLRNDSLKSNIHCIKRKKYSYATKTDSELRENHFFAVPTFRNYCKELNCMEMTKECPESKDKHFYARSYLSTRF